jgi:hypothetical protein
LKRKRAHKAKTKSTETLKRQMQQSGLLGSKQVVFTDIEGPKLSAALLEFIAPYKKDAPTHEAYEKLIAIAVVAWNTAILTGSERQKLIDTTVGAIAGSAGDEWRQETERIIAMMMKRKERYFADDNRYVVDYRITETPKEFHLSVAWAPGDKQLASYTRQTKPE